MNTKPTTVSPFCKTIIKSLISCEICHVTLTEISDYECHLRSSEHIRNWELRGTGAAPQFVECNTDSQATNTVEVSTKSHEVQNNNLDQLTPMCENLELIPFPLLYCDACEVLLSTARQFINHVNAESHILNVQKKDKVKVKEVQPPVSKKYYCFSCQILLNSSSQFNEHKMGKKHKYRCAQLIATGILIPPEEQLPEWDLPKTEPDKLAHYPEFYERFVLTKQKEELEKSGDLKELLMIENGGEANDDIKPVDATNATDTLEEAQNLNSFPRHIYLVQNKDLDPYSELPFTLLANNYSLRDSQNEISTNRAIEESKVI